MSKDNQILEDFTEKEYEHGWAVDLEADEDDFTDTSGDEFSFSDDDDLEDELFDDTDEDDDQD
jgi:hypothetical protein